MQGQDECNNGADIQVHREPPGSRCSHDWGKCASTLASRGTLSKESKVRVHSRRSPIVCSFHFFSTLPVGVARQHGRRSWNSLFPVWHSLNWNPTRDSASSDAFHHHLQASWLPIIVSVQHHSRTNVIRLGHTWASPSVCSPHQGQVHSPNTRPTPSDRNRTKTRRRRNNQLVPSWLNPRFLTDVPAVLSASCFLQCPWRTNMSP